VRAGVVQGGDVEWRLERDMRGCYEFLCFYCFRCGVSSMRRLNLCVWVSVIRADWISAPLISYTGLAPMYTPDCDTRIEQTLSCLISQRGADFPHSLFPQSPPLSRIPRGPTLPHRPHRFRLSLLIHIERRSILPLILRADLLIPSLPIPMHNRSTRPRTLLPLCR